MSELIYCEFGLVPTYHENDNGTVTLERLCFPKSSHNLLPYMDEAEIALAQERLDSAESEKLLKRAELLRENAERRGDARRELVLQMQREWMGCNQRQRGVKLP